MARLVRRLPWPVALACLIASTMALAEARARTEHRVASRRSCIDVPEGDSIQRAIDRHRPGSAFCLSGTFRIRHPIEPKSGDRFTGPAMLVAANGSDHAFDLKRAHARNVVIKELDISGFDVSGIQCWLGAVIRGSSIHGNDRNGIGCGLENLVSRVVVRGNEIWNNGSEDDAGSGAGGMKFARSGVPGDAGSGVTVVGNDVHGNVGNGIWFDVDSAGDVISDNIVTANSRKGILYEISAGPARIFDNVVTGNNTSKLNTGAGISIVSSMRVRVTGNSFGENFNWGVKIRATSRGHRLKNIRIHDNDLNGDEMGGCSLDGTRCWANAS
jgi:parallel beta helix pectate lyase-like protein